MRRELLIVGLVLLLIGGCVGYLVRGAGEGRWEVHQAQTSGEFWALDRRTGKLFMIGVGRENGQTISKIYEIPNWPPED